MYYNNPPPHPRFLVLTAHPAESSLIIARAMLTFFLEAVPSCTLGKFLCWSDLHFLIALTTPVVKILPASFVLGSQYMAVYPLVFSTGFDSADLNSLDPELEGIYKIFSQKSQAVGLAAGFSLAVYFG